MKRHTRTAALTTLTASAVLFGCGNGSTAPDPASQAGSDRSGAPASEAKAPPSASATEGGHASDDAAEPDDAAETGDTGYVPTPEEIDAMLADPRLHQGLAPNDLALAPPPPRETTPEPPKTNPQRRDFGARVLAALAGDDPSAMEAFTPLGDPALAAACPGVTVDRRAFAARVRHCQTSFEWARIVDARVNGGEPTAATVEGCADDVRRLKRVRVQIKTETGRHDAELRDAVGRGDQILGFLGALTCVAR